MVCNYDINSAYVTKTMVHITLELKKKIHFLDPPHPNAYCIVKVLIYLAYFRNYMQPSSYYILL